MATAILSSQNSLNHRLDHRNPNPRLNRRLSHASATTVPRRRNRTTTKSVVSPPTANPNLVMGQVKILKRGETLTSIVNNEKTIDFELVNRIGPEPDIVQKQIGSVKGLKIVSVSAGGYAGSGYSTSPSPSSVPIPCFLGKNKLLA